MCLLLSHDLAAALLYLTASQRTPDVPQATYRLLALRPRTTGSWYFA